MKPQAGPAARSNTGWMHAGIRGFAPRRPAPARAPRDAEPARPAEPAPLGAALSAAPPAADELELPLTPELLRRLREAGL